MNFKEPETRTFSHLLKELVLVKKYVMPISFLLGFFSYALNNELKEVFSGGVSEHIALFSAFFTLSLTIFCYGTTLTINKDSSKLRSLTSYFGAVSIYLFAAANGVIISLSIVHMCFYTIQDGLGLLVVGSSFLLGAIIICFCMSKDLYEGKVLFKKLPLDIRIIGVVFILLGIASMYLSIQQQLEIVAKQSC